MNRKDRLQVAGIGNQVSGYKFQGAQAVTCNLKLATAF